MRVGEGQLVYLLMNLCVFNKSCVSVSVGAVVAVVVSVFVVSFVIGDVFTGVSISSLFWEFLLLLGLPL